MGTATVTQKAVGCDDLLDDVEYVGVLQNTGAKYCYTYWLGLDEKYDVDDSVPYSQNPWTRMYQARFTYTFDAPEEFDMAYDGHTYEKVAINNGEIIVPENITPRSPVGKLKNCASRHDFYYGKSSEMLNDIFGENALVKSVPSGKKVVGVMAKSNFTNLERMCGEALVNESFFENGASVFGGSSRVRYDRNIFEVYKYSSIPNEQVDLVLPIEPGNDKVYFINGECLGGYTRGQELAVKDGRISESILLSKETAKNNRTGYIEISYSEPPADDGIEMYRLYNPNSTEHLYTDNAGERDWLLGSGWKYEGVAWKAPKYATRPVYRLFNPYTGEHHYTMDTGERGYLLGSGWNDEGVGWRTYDSGTPVYRLFNPNNPGAGSHHYTTDAGEKDWLASTGCNYEGIAWYGL